MTHKQIVSALLALPRPEWVVIAKRTGVPLSTVRKVAHGHNRDPRASTLEPLAREFDRRSRA